MWYISGGSLPKYKTCCYIVIIHTIQFKLSLYRKRITNGSDEKKIHKNMKIFHSGCILFSFIIGLTTHFMLPTHSSVGHYKRIVFTVFSVLILFYFLPLYTTPIPYRTHFRIVIHFIYFTFPFAHFLSDSFTFILFLCCSQFGTVVIIIIPIQNVYSITHNWCKYIHKFIEILCLLVGFMNDL